MISTFLACIAFAQDPTTKDYQKTWYKGFEIMTEKKLRTENKKLYDQTHELLRDQLDLVIEVIPFDKQAKLKQSKIWIDYSSRSESAMCYHPSKEWLKQNQYNPDKAEGVEISHPEKFLAWIKAQPYMVLHEFAHSYHHRQLGFDNKLVAEHYERVKKAGLYDEVAHVNGGKVKHYALTNPMEYFAEMTESYFGKNDMYPFNRTELKSHDPKTYDLIEKIWLN